MRVVRAAVTPFAVPFRRPLVTGAGTVTLRRGFLLTLVDQHGRSGRGEASPAYWLGEEDLAATAAVLEGAPALAGRTYEEVAGAVAAWRARAPAAACALDTACLDLAARAAGVPLARQLDPRAGTARELPRRLPVAALVSAAAPAAVAREVRDAVGAGYRTMKLKVGGRALADDVARVAAARAAGGPAVRLRLDANRAWDLARARAALAALAPFAPDFIEEPLAASDPLAWECLRDFGVPLARDESITSLADDDRLGPSAAVLVVKAARLGGPTAAWALGARARAAGRRVVVTDALETITGGALAAQLAALLHEPDDAVGLGGARVLDPTSVYAPRPQPWADVGGPGLGEQDRGALAS